MNPYTKEYFDALYAKYPYFKRPECRQEAIDAWLEAAAKKYPSHLGRAGYQTDPKSPGCPAIYWKPSAWTKQNERISSVPAHKTRARRDVIVKENAPRKRMRPTFRRHPETLTIDGVLYARPRALKWDSRPQSLFMYLNVRKDIRRHRVTKTLCYYRVSDFNKARANKYSRVKRRQRGTVDRIKS